MGLVNKILGGSTALLMIICSILFIKVNNKETEIGNLKQEILLSHSQIISLQMELDSSLMDYTNTIRETQSVLAQVHNKNKSLEKENINLRKGVRLDLLRVRVRRNGKIIDSTYQIAYKYLNK